MLEMTSDSLQLLPHATTINIDDTAINFTEISFNWDQAISHQCSDVLYRINATSCGICPIATNVTTVTCRVTRDGILNNSYIFAVQTVVHGNTIGHQIILSVVELSGN